MTEKKKDVHTEHCCFLHGCKYKSSLCPVTSGAKKQSFPCEQCVEEGAAKEPEAEAVTIHKVPCRKCGITDELCLCAAKAYIRELEAKIELLENGD